MHQRFRVLHIIGANAIANLQAVKIQTVKMWERKLQTKQSEDSNADSYIYEMRSLFQYQITHHFVMFEQG